MIAREEECRVLAREILDLDGRATYMDSDESYVAQAMIGGYAVTLAQLVLGEDEE